jgi:hypothetical protein
MISVSSEVLTARAAADRTPGGQSIHRRRRKEHSQQRPIQGQLRGPSENFVESPYNSESELGRVVVMVSLSKYLP